MQCVARSFSVKEASTGAFEALFKELAAKAHAEEPGLLLCQVLSLFLSLLTSGLFSPNLS